MAAKRGKASTEEEAALKEKYRLLKKVQAEKEAAAANAGKKKDLTAQERLEEAKKALQAQGALADKSAKLPVKFQRRLDDPEVAIKEEAEKRRRVEAAAVHKEVLVPKPKGSTPGAGEDDLGGFHANRKMPKELTQKDPDGQEFYPTTIFIGDTPADVDEKELENGFSKFGPIQTIRTLPGKNFAFVKFYTQEAAHKAIREMNLGRVAGVVVRVSRAKVPQPQSKWKSLDDPSVLDPADVDAPRPKAEEKAPSLPFMEKKPADKPKEATPGKAEAEKPRPEPPKDELTLGAEEARAEARGRQAVVYDDL